MIIEAKIVRMTKTTMPVISVLALVLHQFHNVEISAELHNTDTLNIIRNDRQVGQSSIQRRAN